MKIFTSLGKNGKNDQFRSKAGKFRSKAGKFKSKADFFSAVF